jgi:hypothetical protein
VSPAAAAADWQGPLLTRAIKATSDAAALQQLVLDHHQAFNEVRAPVM